MSSDVGSALYSSLYAWVTDVRKAAAYAYQDEAPQITNRIERDVLATRVREASHLLTALADRLELFDA